MKEFHSTILTKYFPNKIKGLKPNQKEIIINKSERLKSFGKSFGLNF